MKFTRDFYIPKGSTKVADKLSSAVAYLYERNGILFAMGFHGRADKPDWHFRFKTAHLREKHIREHFQAWQARAKRVEDHRAEAKAWVNDYKVGDMLNTCWGYDQTNREFFEVIAVNGKMLTLREVAQTRRDTGYNQWQCGPLPGDYIGDPIIRRAQQYGIKIDDVRRAHRSSYKEVGSVRIYGSLSASDGH